ncbi:MAG: hypothetical protein KF775_00400 [Cyclobacteriaceae bacterium]|nr:hypothetical protein [Cyclobacteriaceae bacterium]
MGYSIRSVRNLNDEKDVQVNYTGTGGLTRYSFGSGVKIYKNLSLGTHLYLLHGSITKAETLESGTQAGLEISSKTYLTGLGMDGGLQYRLHVTDKSNVVVGAVYTPAINLNTEKQLAVVNSLNLDSLYSELYGTADYVVPAKTGFGVSYNTPHHLFALDFMHANYPTAYTRDNVQIRDTYRFSGGYEFKGTQTPMNYWSYVRTRFSLYAQQNETLINSQKYLNWGSTAGIAIPTPNGRGFVNLTYNYNHLGTSSRSLIIQHTHSFALDFSIQDLWGSPQKI